MISKYALFYSFALICFSKMATVFAEPEVSNTASSPVSEALSLLKSDHPDDMASGLNKIEILSLDADVDSALLVAGLRDFLTGSRVAPGLAFRAVEITRSLTDESTDELRELREHVFFNYFLRFRDSGTYSMFNPEISKQLSTAVALEPALALHAALDARLNKVDGFLIHYVGELGREETSFSGLEIILSTRSSDVDAQRRRDYARFAKFQILIREVLDAHKADRREDFHSQLTKALRLLIDTEFETKSHNLGASFQQKAKSLVYASLTEKLPSTKRAELLTPHLSELETLLEISARSRPELLDYRLSQIFGEIGAPNSIPLLQKAAARSGKDSKVFKESIYGMEVRDGTGKWTRSGGAIERIKNRHPEAR
jgi:hypothetical protein